MTQIEHWSPTGIVEVDRAVAMWRPSSMVPAQFVDKQGRAKLADLQLAAMWLYALDVPPVPNLPQLYVIHGRVGIMAELQRALIARAGYDLEVTESTADRAVVRIRRYAEPWKPDVTVTLEDAKRAGLAKPKGDAPSMYSLYPDRMLAARACTKAISLYAPGALSGIAAPASHIAALEEEGGPDPGPAPLGEVGAGPGNNLPPRSVAPSGATIPEHLREPEVESHVRAWLISRVEALTDTDRTTLGQIVHPIRLPNLKSRRFTQAHAMLLDRLLEEISGPASGGGPPVAEGAAPYPAPAGPDQPPAELYDSSHEARNYDYTDEETEPF